MVRKSKGEVLHETRQNAAQAGELKTVTHVDLGCRKCQFESYTQTPEVTYVRAFH